MKSEERVRAAFEQFSAIGDDELTPSQLAVLDALTWVLDDTLTDTYVTDYLPFTDGDDATSPLPAEPLTESGH